MRTKRKPPTKKTIFLIAIASILVIAGGGAGVFWWTNSQPPISSKVRDKVSFAILSPKHSDYRIAPESVRYDSSAKILTFSLKHDDTSITFTEQATPDLIASFPDMLSRQFDMKKNKKTIATSAGTIYVATNQDLHQQQVGAMNSKGTLLFAQPNHALDEDTWRQLFSDVVEIK